MFAAVALSAVLAASPAVVAPADLVLFDEPGFPRVDAIEPPPAIPVAVTADSIDALDRLLEPDDVLVWRHGSAFPIDAWSTVRRFLESGGSLLVLGGQPFTRPVRGDPGAREVEARSLAMLEALRLNQCRVVTAEHATLDWRGGPAPRERSHPRIAVLEPRLCETRDFDDEDGAPGARDAIVRPFAVVREAGDDPRFPFATAAYAIDWLRGPYAGGRWVFWLADFAPTEDELAYLVAEARRPPIDLRVDPTFGSFKDGETPSVLVRVHRPRGGDRQDATLDVRGDDGPIGERTVTLAGGRHASARVPLPLVTRPGLYRVVARAEGAPTFETGFWVHDEELFRSGGALSFDAYTLRRDGVPEPVIGTTTMSGSVHRKFLFEPNAAEWDDTFAELASLRVNLVRTGVWSAYRKISLDPNVVDESFLRALEAYYLTARRHGIPVTFTFFAFVPDRFGGDNPYFDPRAIEGQRAYLSAVASRFRDAKEILWDLINEPSFSSPDKLWVCRPHGDANERAAFLTWLKDRHGERWEEEVRSRWRLRPDEPIGLPADADFDDRAVLEGRRPYRAKEYVQFAQDAFAGWIVQMNSAIRDAGSLAPITVGQDEGGLNERPGPLHHHDSVDFTSIHTWWYDDAQYWDVVMAKAPRVPLLVSETGIMNRELLSGESMRTPVESARLLSRKIAYAFAGRAFGVVEWCYEVNPYMASDNEVAIGLKRADGSYKPEHRVLRAFAAFVHQNRAWFEAPEEPEVAIVFPSSDHYPPRGMQAASTRAWVDVLPMPIRVVPEDRVASDLGHPKLIVLPACRGLADDAWDGIMAEVAERGAVLRCSGFLGADAAGRARDRLGLEPRPLRVLERFQDRDVRFPLAVVESWYAARSDGAGGEGGEGGDLRTSPGASGPVVFHTALPLEWSTEPRDLLPYEDAARAAGVDEPREASLLFIRRVRFRDATLAAVVNETAEPIEARRLSEREDDGDLHLVPPGEGHLFLFSKAGVLLDRTEPCFR